MPSLCVHTQSGSQSAGVSRTQCGKERCSGHKGTNFIYTSTAKTEEHKASATAAEGEGERVILRCQRFGGRF